ncbi:MAG TPA: sulfotransferase [Acidimicrobiales bacterium]|nr:sulfotransferase [Acidimicrobiales bacterium]
MSRPPFPFFVGCGRSGTTLVRALVDGHPAMAVPPESHFVVALAPRRGEVFAPGAFADALAASDRFALWGMDRAAVAGAVEAAGAATYPDAVRTVFAGWAADRGKARYADKTPGYVVHIPALAALFPEATFVQVVRDGRDVAASFVELGWAAGVTEAALHWRLRVRRGRRDGRALGSGRYHELRYEDLVADPEAALRRLCDQIDVAWDPAMLDHRARAADVARTTSHPDYHRRLAAPVTADLRDWRRDLPEADVARIEAVAGDALAELGYDRSGLRPPTRLRAEAAAARARWELHRARNRLRR